MPKAGDYTWIAKWGHNMGSNGSYIRDQQAEAAAEGAPLNATHKRHDGSWSTTDDILRPDTRFRLGLSPEPPGTVGHQVEINVVVAYRTADYTLAYGDGDTEAPEYLRALVQELVSEKLRQLGWGCVPGVQLRSKMPGREQEMQEAEQAAKQLADQTAGK